MRINWTPEETKLLIQLYPNLENREIGKILNRSLSSVTRKGSKVKLKKSWGTGTKPVITPDGFIEDAKIMTYEELSTKYFITVGAVKNLKQKHNLTVLPDKWTIEEENYLKENINSYSSEQLALKLNKPYSTVTKKISKNNIRKKSVVINKLWTKENCDYLINNWNSIPVKELAIYFGNITENAVRVKASELKLLTKRTTPEKEIKLLLESLDIKFQEQYRIGKYKADFYFLNNLVIEVMGDYWHCNPKVYKTPTSQTQINNLKNDKEKRIFIQSKSFKLIYIWEKDIKNNPAKVKNILLNFIHKHNG